MNCKYRRERNYVNNKLLEIEKKLKEFGYSDEDVRNLKNDKTEEVDIIFGLLLKKIVLIILP